MDRFPTINKKSGPETTRLVAGPEGGPVYLEYDKLNQTGIVRHAFSTRLGGVSEGKYASMNLSCGRGDREEAVKENFRRMARVLSAEPSDFVFSHQTHTVNIRTVTEEDRGKGAVKERDYQDVDGLVTNVKGIVLTTFYADCVPLFFVDPVHGAVGLAHSGWRGTVGKIGRKMVERMNHEYGTIPGELIAAVGPSICAGCYEVGEDVAGAFKDAFPEQELSGILIPADGGKYQLDLWKANEWILRDAGLEACNIALPDLCTCCNPQLLFSHRATGGERGSLAAFLKLESDLKPI